MTFSPLAQNLWALGGLVFWILAYGLMIRRGVRDRSYGMPVAALMFNIAWETWFSLFSEAPVATRAGIGLYLIADLGVLWTCLRYGREDFESPLIRNHFPWWVLGFFVMGLVLVRQFALSFEDIAGGISATFTTVLLSVLLVAMLVRRNDVRGQSLYIALAVLFGNVCGFFMNLIAHQTVQPGIPIPWVVTANAVIVGCNILYIGLFLHVARRDGVDPLRRL